MDVRCEKCLTEYEFDDAKVTEAGVTVKCTTCGFVFKVKKRLAPAPAAPAARSDEFSPDAAAIDRVREWKIRQPHGNVFTCRELTTLQKWIVERKVSRDDEISLTGDNWKRLGDIPELAGFFMVVDQANRVSLLEEQIRSGPQPTLQPTFLNPGPQSPPRTTSGNYELGREPTRLKQENPAWMASPSPERAEAYEEDLQAIKPSRGPGMWILVGALLAGGGGAAVYYFKIMPQQQGATPTPTPVAAGTTASTLAATTTTTTTGTPTAIAPTATTGVAIPVAAAGTTGSGSGSTGAAADAGAPTTTGTTGSTATAGSSGAGSTSATASTGTTGAGSTTGGSSTGATGTTGAVKPATTGGAVVAAYKPKTFEGWMAVGAVYEKREKPEKAFEAYSAAVELEPGSAEAWSGKGQALFDLDRHSEAEQAFRKALGISGRFADAEIGLAEVLKKEGKKAEAIKQYKKFIDDHPDDENVPAARNSIKSLSD